MKRLPLAAPLLLAAAAVAAAQVPSTRSGQPVPAADKALEAIPRDGFAVLTVKAPRLWDHPAMKPLRDWAAGQKGGTLEGALGVAPADLDRLTLYMPAFADEPPLVLVSTRQPYNEARLIKNLGADRADAGGRRLASRVGNVVGIAGRGEFDTLVLVDDRTYLLLAERNSNPGVGTLALLGQLLGRSQSGPLTTALAEAANHAIVLGLDVPQLASALAAQAGKEGFPFAPYRALLRAKTAVFTADLEDGAKGRLVLTFPDAAAAKRAGPVLEELIDQFAGVFTAEAKREGEERTADRLLAGWVAGALKSAKVTVKDDLVVATADGPTDKAIGELAALLPKSIEVSANNTRAMNNLKQLLLAVHNYNDTFGFCPGDVGPDGKTPWSWRVQLLPFVEQDQLYRRLNQQRPWDDPANKQVLESAEMPKVFEVPGRPAPKGHTYWRIFSKPKNAKWDGPRPWLMEGQKGPGLAQIPDGTSNTFLIVEAGESVPWYAPDVFAYDPDKPLPPLGGKEASRFLAGMGDGSVRTVSKKNDEKTLRIYITVDDGIPNPDLK